MLGRDKVVLQTKLFNNLKNDDLALNADKLFLNTDYIFFKL
jgi:hypothetical protein